MIRTLIADVFVAGPVSANLVEVTDEESGTTVDFEVACERFECEGRGFSTHLTEGEARQEVKEHAATHGDFPFEEAVTP